MHVYNKSDHEYRIIPLPVHPKLDLKTASTIATTIVHAKLDYCIKYIKSYHPPYNKLKSTQPSYHHRLFKNQPLCSTCCSSTLTPSALLSSHH